MKLTKETAVKIALEYATKNGIAAQGNVSANFISAEQSEMVSRMSGNNFTDFRDHWSVSFKGPVDKSNLLEDPKVFVTVDDETGEAEFFQTL